MARTQRVRPAVSSPGSPPHSLLMIRFSLLARASVLAALVLALPACDSTDGGDGGSDPGGLFTQAAANKGTWNYVAIPGNKCRDGSPTGIGVRLQEGATNTMIYLEGGGACFNAATCSGNPSRFGSAEFAARVAGSATSAGLNEGIFSTDASNAVGRWNQVYVPYCTGDVHSGSAADATISGVAGTQQFVGHQNIVASLDLLRPYLGAQGKVLLTGASAGGFGTLLNFPTVDEHFSSSQTYLLDDSGPIFFADNVLSPQLAQGLTLVFNLPGTLRAPELYGTDGLQNIYTYLGRTYPDTRFALVSHLEDATIRGFFSFGQAPNDPITGDEYAAGLRDIRAQLPSNWGTYFATGADHTFIALGERYTGTSAGVALNTYVGALVNGSVSNVDPAPTRPAPLSGVLAAR